MLVEVPRRKIELVCKRLNAKGTSALTTRHPGLAAGAPQHYGLQVRT